MLPTNKIYGNQYDPLCNEQFRFYATNQSVFVQLRNPFYANNQSDFVQLTHPFYVTNKPVFRSGEERHPSLGAEAPLVRGIVCPGSRSKRGRPLASRSL